MPYRLLVIWGLVEPSLSADTAEDWDVFERLIVEYLRTGGYKSGETGVFSVEVDGKGKLKGVHAFSADFWEEMEFRARSPKAWRPKRRK